MDKDISLLLAQLQKDKSLKVWSLIVTLFGDAVVSRGGNVSAKTIQAVLGSMGIGAGAVRTALSRLASDNWIERQKLGRESFYELAKDGYAPFEKASVRIYAPAHAKAAKKNHNKGGSWAMSLAQPGTAGATAPKDGIAVANNCWLSFHADNNKIAANNNLVITGELNNVPNWLTDALLPEPLRLGYETLMTRFSSIKNIKQLSPIDALVLRCLLIHEWRRLLLRTPLLPIELQTKSWPEHACRQHVHALYHQLIDGSEAWLDEHGTSVHGPLPSAIKDIHHRFTTHYNQ